MLRSSKGLEDTWQLHKANRGGAHNSPDAFIANLEVEERDRGDWIKLSAEESGSFTITNGRTRVMKSYR